jgi:hypothetical protein
MPCPAAIALITESRELSAMISDVNRVAGTAACGEETSVQTRYGLTARARDLIVALRELVRWGNMANRGADRQLRRGQRPLRAGATRSTADGEQA